MNPLHAVDIGEPRAALGSHDEPGVEITPERAAALQWLCYVLQYSWAPGPIGFTPQFPLPPPPPSPGETDDLAATWWGQVLPDFIHLRNLARGARRAGVEGGAELHRRLAAPRLAMWAAIVVDHPDLLARVWLEAATIARLAGLDAGEERERAEAAARAAGPEALAAYRIEVGDAVLTPLGSPETLGLDLDDREAPPVLGDAMAREMAAGAYDEARAALGDTVGLRLRAAVLDHLADRHDEAIAGLEAAREQAVGAEGPLVLTHLALMRVLAGDVASSRPGPISEIAEWAEHRGGPSYALGCAALLHATGCTARERGQVDVALALFDLADRLHLALGDPVGRIEIVVSRAELYDRLRCRGATIATIEETWDAAMGLVAPDGRLEQIPWTRLAHLLSWLTGQLLREGDPAGFPLLRRRLQQLLERAPVDLPDLSSTDMLSALDEAGDRIADLGRDRAGPWGGGRDWDEASLQHLEITVRAMRDNLVMADVMEPDVEAMAALDRGDVAAADRAFQQALEAADRTGDPTYALFVLIGMRRRAELSRRLDALEADGVHLPAERAAAFRLEAGEPREAAALLDSAGLAEPPAETGLWRPQWEGCLLRARIALADGRLDDAERHADEGVARFDRWFPAVSADAFRVSVLDDGDVRRLFEVLADVALRRHDAAATLRAADRLRSLALGAVAAESLVEGPASAAVRRRREAHATWNGMFDRRRVAWRDRDAETLRRSRADLDAAQTELDAAVAAAPAPVPTPVPEVDAEAVAAALEPDTLLVHYTATDDVFILTTVTCDGLDVVSRTVPRRELFGAATRVHRTWSRGARAHPGDVTALGEALLEPVRALMADHDRVVVVPNGALHALPFAALELGGEPLVERWTVSQLPAAALVPRFAGRSSVRPARGSVVVGDPLAADLPGARVEAVTIARMLGTAPLVGEHADEPSVRRALAGAGGIAHLATHGLLDEEAPDLSSLMLAGDELTVAELVGMGLDTDLAVLSACDSGRGEVTQGGDVVGLARGLLAAGVRHAVVTAWPVDDHVACLVMVRFVERVAAGTPVARALAAAQREVRSLSAAEREEQYRDLAREADLPDDGADVARRRSRDVRPRATAAVDPQHPSWWAGFVHLGV